MQTCYNCGRQVSDETLICPDCGALVRRYTDAPPRTDPALSQQPVQPVAETFDSKTMRFRGLIKVWLIILIVLSAQMFLTCVGSVAIGRNADAIMELFREPGMEDLAESMGEMLDVLSGAVGLYGVMAFLFACKLGCHIWLLCSRRKTPFYVSIGVSLAALFGIAFLGGSVMAVVYFLDPLVTWVNLRHYWPYMEK